MVYLPSKAFQKLKENDSLLMNKEKDLESTDKELVVKESSIEALSNILMLKQDETKSLEDSINREKAEIDSLKRYLALKEKELNKKESMLLENSDEDLGVEEEKTNYGEVLEDDLLESVFVDNSKNTNYIDKLSNMFYLVISYIGGIVTHLFTKRRLNG